MLRHAIVTFFLLGCYGASQDNDVQVENTDEDLLHRRDLHGYEEPAWYSRLEVKDTTGLLSRCFKKKTAPETGSDCGRKDKTCYFGEQDCDGVGSHPEKKCECSERKWTCFDETCPVSFSPTIDKTGCPPPGGEIDHGNPASCPIISPLNDGDRTCTAEQEGASCSYGSEKCCGQCHAEHSCSCSGGQFDCFFTDACMLPPCYSAVFDVTGKSCSEASTTISATFPGMDIICQKEAAPSPTDDDFNRYVVYTNDIGIATSVALNRAEKCSDTKMDSCRGGETCTWGKRVTYETMNCDEWETCSCVAGGWRQCSLSSSCSPNTASSIECPDAKTDLCKGVGQKCSWTERVAYETMNCNESESCTCSSDGWSDCSLSSSCKPNTASSVECPDTLTESCTGEGQACTWTDKVAYKTTNCDESTTCTCASGAWRECSLSSACVQNTTPSIP